MIHLTHDVLERSLDHIRQSPRDDGELHLIAQRPTTGERIVVDEGLLDETLGLVGDDWLARGSRHTPDGAAVVDMQVTVMNIRLAQLVAVEWERVPLAGDQLYVDLDLSVDNLPPGTRLAVGDAVLEVTAEPHLGCKKFVARFGADAMRFVNGPVGRPLRLRGMHTRVVVPGRIQLGDRIRKTTVTIPVQDRARAVAPA